MCFEMWHILMAARASVMPSHIGVRRWER